MPSRSQTSEGVHQPPGEEVVLRRERIRVPKGDVSMYSTFAVFLRVRGLSFAISHVNECRHMSIFLCLRISVYSVVVYRSTCIYRRAGYPATTVIPSSPRFQLSAKTPEPARTVPKSLRTSSWHLTSCSETPLWSSAHAFHSIIFHLSCLLYHYCRYGSHQRIVWEGSRSCASCGPPGKG